MPLPRYRDVDLALLLELVRAKRAMRPSETYAPVALHFPDLTEADMAQTRSDGRTKAFENMVHWSRDHLRVRGLLVSQRGLWQVSDGAMAALEGDLLARGADSTAIPAFVRSNRSLADLLGPKWAPPVRAR